MTISIQLPEPWKPGMTFALDEQRPLIWLVGPNGSGKSRFLRSLRDHSELTNLRPRFISTDRLAAARGALAFVVNGAFKNGMQKTQFPSLIAANHSDGAIVGTVTLLYERPDLRIRVEATLSQLLSRSIRLEMTDGRLTPKIRDATSTEYEMLSDECHGVLELLVLLANIYDNDTQLLLIDEPEQNLHPQYQAFVLDEIVRARKKAVLATHSPSFLSARTLDELRGVICFHADFSAPSAYRSDAVVDKEVAEVVPRMTEQHRAFFFASTPVFVEGYFDANVIGAIQRALGLSAEAAGSCLIPCLGKEEASRYLILCNALGKTASFVFDLDALFDQRLQVGALQNPKLAAGVAAAGHERYDKLIGELQQALTTAIKSIEAIPADKIAVNMQPLRDFLAANGGASQKDLNRRRIAVLVAIAEENATVKSVLGTQEAIIAGLLQAIILHLRSCDIHLLPGGALENYLPSYQGNRFKIPDDAKRATAIAEQAWLATPRGRAAVLGRYRDLAQIVERLPARTQVDIGPTLRRELADFLHHLIMGIRAGQVLTKERIAAVLGTQWSMVSNFVEVAELQVKSRTDFSGVLRVLDRFGIGIKECRFDHQTQTNDSESLKLTDAQRDTVAMTVEN